MSKFILVFYVLLLSGSSSAPLRIDEEAGTTLFTASISLHSLTCKWIIRVTSVICFVLISEFI